jgi:hypothetical protein
LEFEIIFLNFKHVFIMYFKVSYLEACPVEGDVGDALDGAVVKDVGYQEQASYLFNDWGLKQSVV